MKHHFSTKRVCRAGIIAALYVALTYVFMPVAYQGIFQIRPGEALTILPLFFPEAVPALWIGCMISNLTSPFLVYDLPIGGAATLIAALGTYLIGRLVRETYDKKPLRHFLRISLGGIFPVLVNALIIPLIIVFLCKDTQGNTASVAYLLNFGSMCLTQSVWVYGLGAPLYLFLLEMRARGVPGFSDKRSAAFKKDYSKKSNRL